MSSVLPWCTYAQIANREVGGGESSRMAFFPMVCWNLVEQSFQLEIDTAHTWIFFLPMRKKSIMIASFSTLKS